MREREFLRGFGALGLCLGLACQLNGQEPARPPSDSSTAPPGTSGTNYLRVNTGEQKGLLQEQQIKNLEKIARETISESPAAYAVTPTSDQSNSGSTSQFKVLLEEINPALVSAQELESYTNYQVIRPQGVDIEHYNTDSPVGTRPEKIRQYYGVPDNLGSGVIAIVDAFHYPNVASDLNKFSATFGLANLPECPKDSQTPFTAIGPCLYVASNASSPVNCGWNTEAALDLEWAHAMAPKASLLFVEAASRRDIDLFGAVKFARDLIMPLHGELSLSWGSPKEVSQSLVNRLMFTPGVLYFAATGDTGGQLGFPADFANVIAVGGTVLQFGGDGDPVAETGWDHSGGGVSMQVKPLPQFQAYVENVDPHARNTPDLSAIADTNPSSSALPAYVSTPTDQCADHPSASQYKQGWTQISGTSLASPIIAGITNAANHGRTSTAEELVAIYGNRKDPSRIRDIVLMVGSAGGNTVKQGYDHVTGVGSPASLDFDAGPVR